MLLKSARRRRDQTEELQLYCLTQDILAGNLCSYDAIEVMLAKRLRVLQVDKVYGEDPN